MTQLTTHERALLTQASEKAGWSRKQVAELLEGIRSGVRYSELSANGVSGMPSPLPVPLPTAPTAPANFSLAYDFDIPESHSAGYDDKQEANLLRIRLSDISQTWGRKAVMARLPHMSGLGPVLQISLFVASIAFRGNFSWLDQLIEAGWTAGDNAHFISIAKKTNIIAKAFQVAGWDNKELMELHALTGYSFARSAEVMAELNQEAVDMTESKPTFLPAYPDCYYIEEQMEDYGYTRLTKSLPEYIESLDWLAPGGAALTGVPKMEVLVDGKVVKLRVTKNRLPFLTTPEYVGRLVASSMGQFFAEPKIKSEQQKFRWIYNVNTAANLLLSYICDSIKDPNYPGTTLGEDFFVLSNRLWVSVHEIDPLATPALTRELKEYMPWLYANGLKILPAPTPEQEVWMGDYVGMDKQIRNWQQCLWVERVCNGVQAPDWLKSKAMSMMYNSYMLDPRASVDEQAAAKKTLLERTATADLGMLLGIGPMAMPPVPPKQYLFMRGGLASGSRITTYINTTVNMVNLRLCARIVNKIRPGAVSNLEARGDDSKVTCETRAVALLFHALISACGDISPDKSRVGRNSEFLRIQFVPAGLTNNRYSAPAWGASGILARSVGTLVQRKPISTERASMHLNKMVELLTQLPACVRRGAHPRLTDFCWALADRVARESGIEPEWYNALQSHGGAGLGLPNNRRYKVGAKPQATASAGPWAIARNVEQYADFKVTASEAAKIANSDMAAIGLTSDEPEVKEAWKENKPLYAGQAPARQQRHRRITFDEAQTMASRALFGAGKEIAARFTKAAVVARARGMRAIQLLSEMDLNVIRKVEKRLKCSRRAAVDWLAGRVGYNAPICSPELARILAVRTAAQYLASYKNAADSAYVMSMCAAYEAVQVHTAWRYLYSW